MARARFSAGHVAWTAMACGILILIRSELRPGELGNTGNWYRIVLVLFAALVCGFGIMKKGGRVARAFAGPLILFLAYGAIGLVSALYIPQYALYSMWKASEFVIDVLAIALVIGSPQPQASARIAYNVLLALFGTLVFIYWAEALIAPNTALIPSRGVIPFTIQGVMPIMNGNAVAFISAITAFAAWCRMLTRKGARKLAWLALLTLAFGMLILAQSRTSLIGFVIAVVVQLFFARRFGLLGLILLLAAFVAFYTDFGNITERYVVRGQSQQLFSSFSGRTVAWKAAWAAFQESPIRGHGFAAAARAEILGTSGASTLHGAVFDVLVGVGLLGFIPWAAGIVWTSCRLASLGIGAWFRPRRELVDRSAVAEMLGVLTLILVRSTTNSGLALHEYEFMAFLTVLAFTVTTTARRDASALRMSARVQQVAAG